MSTNLQNLDPHSFPAGMITSGELQEENIPPTDHYEILRLRPDADEETIERVYRTLADRFNPDNQATGDPDTFLRVREAWETLSNHTRRAAYNVLREQSSGPARFWLRGRDFFNGVKGGQNRRLALLCLLYRKRLTTHERPGLSILDLELSTGCTREEITTALWYLCEKQWATIGEFTTYSITVDGFDFVESKLEHRLEFRALATLCYYGLPDELEDPEQAGSGFGTLDTLPLDIEPDGSHVDQERFRLRGREFFDGIRGEQLRRLAVLCILYRQSASELPGLTVLELERATGCTREELGSALWYLREKKWAKCGDFTEHSITAAGFDVIENKLDQREAPKSRTAEMQAIGPITISPVTLNPAAPQSPGVIDMNYSTQAIAQQAGGVAVSAAKRVVFSMGGKGGVGKTSVMTGLAEWYGENQIPVTLLDLDIENKACGSLTHFFGGRVPKININTPAGLDTFVDQLSEDAPVILADMGAGAGKVTHDWFEKMYPDVAEVGVVFTAIGVVTSDPASVESVLAWAAALQDRVDYIIVENSLTEYSDFSYWHERDQAEDFQQRFHPRIVRLDNRLAELEKGVRNHGVTLGQVAARTTNAPELKKASLVMRAQSYRRRMFAEFDSVKDLLLP